MALAAHDAEQAAATLALLAQAARDDDRASLAQTLEARGYLRSFLLKIFGSSPFLRDSARRRPLVVSRLLDADAGTRLDELVAAIRDAGLAEDGTEAALMRNLRLFKNEAHVLIALADLSGRWDVSETVVRLSALAEACVNAAVNFLLRDADRRGALRLPDRLRPGVGSGLVVLGMGKLGGRELNFSSDIDLVLFFDAAAPAVAEPMDAADLWARLAKRLLRLLQERTEHGYVFRTDLRLRPDPGSTPLALSTDAAFTYYEGRGQNWERAAFIKARAVAGDREAGARFLNELKPFVWRRYLDFAAINDIHSIKRQIHAHRGLSGLATRGHDVKLGRGGIREVEFFVQTQQLIAGGRDETLRGRETVPTLQALAKANWITAEAAGALTQCYWFLRRVENAIQTVNDEQTHTLPEDGDDLTRVARLLGFEDEVELEEDLLPVLSEVERQYAALFEAAPALSSGLGNLVFTGTADDPGTLDTLKRLGFERPGDIARVVSSWHFGRARATRSADARERLTELTPALLEVFGQTRRADEALLGFDRFLSNLPAGVQLFSLLSSNPGLLRLLATILAAAPNLAATITRRPHVFDAMLDPALLAGLPSRKTLDARLAALETGASGYEDRLDRLRVFAAEARFLIGVRLLVGAISAEQAGQAFSDLAEILLARTLHAVRAEFCRAHGAVSGEEVALLGMGRLGSRELTASSDLDLILLYRHDEGAERSDGPVPLAPSHYFARLTQRLIAAVSAPTAEGVLYPIDLRLRPSGNKGPIATELSAFARYQRREAETWEHMALTRARVVAGDEALAARLRDTIAAVLEGPHDKTHVRRDARAMRALIEAEKPADGAWDLKLAPGGVIDLEFLAQTAVLEGKRGSGPAPTGTEDTLQRLNEPDLVAACRLYAALTQRLRLCVSEPFDPVTAPPGLVDLLLGATGQPDLARLEATLAETQRLVRAAFERRLGTA